MHDSNCSPLLVLESYSHLCQRLLSVAEEEDEEREREKGREPKEEKVERKGERERER